jgi:hypothetical protein
MLLGVVAGGVGSMVLGVASGLVSIGRREMEWKSVLQHVGETEPLKQQVLIHMASGEIHLDPIESNSLAVLPVRLAQLEHRLQAIEATQNEILRRVR